jgi:phosphate-selective porin OprO/OprP
MKLKPLTFIVIAGAQLAGSAFAADVPAANSTNSTNSTDADEIAGLKKEIQLLEQKVEVLERRENARTTSAPPSQVEALQQKVNDLERERQNDREEAAAYAKTQPKIALTQNGFSFTSADSNFVTQLHGVLQLDSRSFFSDGGVNGNDGFLLRRARPILTGTVFRDFDYNFTPDFGGSTVQIVDAYMNYHYNEALQLQAGKFKAPIGLEALVADRDLLFNERALATDLVPNRNLGAQLHGDVIGGAVSYALGLFNGDTDYNGTTVNTPIQDDKSVEGRVFFQPWINSGVKPLRGLGFGVAGSYLANHPQTNSSTGLTPGYTTDGQQKFFTYSGGVNADGAGWRIAPQAYYYWGPVGFLGEYVISAQDVASASKSAHLQNTAWQATGSWVLTGENASYNSVTPFRSFDPRVGHWGALQLVARVAGLDVDDKAFSDGFASSTKSADSALSWAVGLNWYLNRNIRANVSFSRTTFDGFTGKAAPGVVPAQPENVLFTRLQVAF